MAQEPLGGVGWSIWTLPSLGLPDRPQTSPGGAGNQIWSVRIFRASRRARKTPGSAGRVSISNLF